MESRCRQCRSSPYYWFPSGHNCHSGCRLQGWAYVRVNERSFTESFADIRLPRTLLWMGISRLLRGDVSAYCLGSGYFPLNKYVISCVPNPFFFFLVVTWWNDTITRSTCRSTISWISSLIENSEQSHFYSGKGFCLWKYSNCHKYGKEIKFFDIHGFYFLGVLWVPPY